VDRRPAIIARGDSSHPVDHEHRDAPAYVRVTSRGDLMGQTTGVLRIDVADSIQVTGYGRARA
jgi:hypothetical protein